MKVSDEIKQADFPDPYVEAVVSLHFTSHWLYRIYQEQLDGFEISNEQYNILRILRGNRDGTYNLRDVRERMLNRTANATRLVEKLRKRGLVSRQQCALDRRRVDIAITPDGLALLSDMDGPINDMNERVAGALTAAEAQNLTTLLGRLREGLQGSEVADSP